ncbi:hypothetical protein FDECE_6082 [Fusarium decemcellulare]|nr:hypothetical protein FDECE_6082 [Fusarium decemcellulare]
MPTASWPRIRLLRQGIDDWFKARPVLLQSTRESHRLLKRVGPVSSAGVTAPKWHQIYFPISMNPFLQQPKALMPATNFQRERATGSSANLIYEFDLGPQTNSPDILETKRCEPALASAPASDCGSPSGKTDKSPNTDSVDHSVDTAIVGDVLTKVETYPSSSSANKVETSVEHDDDQNESPDNDPHFPGGQRDILQWVLATKNAASVPFTPLSVRTLGSDSSSPAVVPQDLASQGATMTSARALIMELCWTLNEEDSDIIINEPWPAEDCTGQGTHSPSPATDGSGSDASPQSGTTSSALGFEGGHKRPRPPNLGSSQGEDDDEPSRKKPRRGQNPPNPETMVSGQGRVQMPCPMLESQKCLGTNATISELLRSLQVRHRIFICTDCCDKIDQDGNKPEMVLALHKQKNKQKNKQNDQQKGCEPRCIGTTCSGVINDGSKSHSRIATCPTWQSLSREVRWSFIWGLLNPGLPSPAPDFTVGVGFEHSTERRPRKQQLRVRQKEICIALADKMKEQEKHASSLEHKLRAVNDKNDQLRQQYDERIGSLENIIEALLERLEDKNVSVPKSLQKRLHNECPGVFCESGVSLTPERSRAPPTPASIPKEREQRSPLVSSSTQPGFHVPSTNAQQGQSSSMLLQLPHASQDALTKIPDEPQEPMASSTQRLDVGTELTNNGADHQPGQSCTLIPGLGTVSYLDSNQMNGIVAWDPSNPWTFDLAFPLFTGEAAADTEVLQ